MHVLTLYEVENIFHITDQSIELFTTLCNCVNSAMLVNILYIFASWAKSFFVGLVTDGKSLMKIRNRIGPRTLPWGIPLVTLAFVAVH